MTLDVMSSETFDNNFALGYSKNHFFQFLSLFDLTFSYCFFQD